MSVYKIMNRTESIRVVLGGYTGEMYGKVIEQRMVSEFAVKNILAEAEEPFFSKSDDEKVPVGFWRGEFWGKWIIGAVRACKYHKNEKLEAIIRESIDKIIKTADKNGYIGTYRDATRVMPCDKEEARRAVGFPCDFC